MEYPCPIFYRQSEPIITGDQDKGASEATQQTTDFIDEAVGMTVDMPEAVDMLSEFDKQISADLAEFLSRPVKIDSFTWLESDAADLLKRTINPWQLYFSDARIKNKLNNFAFLRCNLKIKILVNASPFYYGCMGAAYQPLPTLTPSTIITGTGQQVLMPLSQRPIVYLYPQHSQGGEMILPFFLHKNWIDINENDDFTDMGKLDFYTFTDLQSANGVTGQGVTVQVFAWAEDVCLSGATVGLALQSQPIDEYGKGPISAPATTIANIAARLRSAPVIGKFATATEIGVRAVASIASLFGYTNVPVIEDIKPLKPCAFPSLASAEISFPNEKLTLDPKNELSIDPTIVGAPEGDPLSVASIVKRESFLVRVNWDTTQAADTILFSSRVNPWMFRQTGDTANSISDFTPLALCAQLFDSWRGDIVFRFKIVASPYHKGRILVAFDPRGDTTDNLVTSSNVTSAVYTQIIDLGETNDVSIRVPYVQALAFLRTNPNFLVSSIPYQTSTSPTWNVNKTLDNGFIIARVLTALTAPVAAAPVRILVYVSGTDTTEFANPRRVGQTVSQWQVQSQEVAVEEQTEVTLGVPGSITHPYQYRVNFGEVISSLRVLLHRANYVYTQAHPDIVTTAVTRITSTFSKVPPYRGYDVNGIHTANKLIGVLTAPYNFVQTTPIQWILPCFVGYRGSTVWTFNPNSSYDLGSVNVTRQPAVAFQWQDTYSADVPLANKSGYAAYFSNNKQATAAGTALTNQSTQAGLSVLCPNYNQYRFNSTRVLNSTLGATSSRSADGTAIETFYMEINTAATLSSAVLTPKTVLIDKYWHAGPDFQVLFFLNVPSYYLQPVTPTAA